jgi:ketosteroid isomerase-like protein
MKTNLLLIFAALALFVGNASAQSSPDLILEQGVAAHKGLDDVYRRFSEGYRKLEAASVANLYTETAAYLAPGGDVEIGRQKVSEIFNRFFDSVKKQNAKMEISFRVLQRRVDKNLAYDVGIYTLVSISEKGEARRDGGKFVVVAIREKGDVRRFQVDGYSDLPKQPK